MVKKKPKNTSIKKLQEITKKTNLLCLADDSSDSRVPSEATDFSSTLKAQNTDAHNSAMKRYTSALSFERVKTRHDLDESIHNDLSNTDISNLKDIFCIFDLQNCGKISFFDLLCALRFLKFSIIESELKEILESSHHNVKFEGDNIGFQVFLWCIVQCQNRAIDWTKIITDVFRSIDAENKGVISFDNLKSLNKTNQLKFSDKDIHGMISVADLSESGDIDKNELMEIILKTNLFC